MTTSEHLSYVVVWPGSRLIKAGYTANKARWSSFANHRDGVIFQLTEFPTERLARAHEAALLGMLDYASTRAFASEFECRREFGKGIGGFTEIYWLPVSRDNLLTLAGWFPDPYLGEIRRTPDQAIAMLEDRRRQAVVDTRGAFLDAIRQAKYRRAVRLGSSAS